MVRYSLLRVLIFLGCLSVLWLVGLRSPGQRPWLVVGAALLSMLISYAVLRPFREETVRRLNERVERRVAERAAAPRPPSDEDIEDDYR